jgi:plastocyanin
VTPTHLARKAIAIPLAVVALAVAPAGASAVADVIKSTNDNQFDKATYYSDAGDLVQFQHTGGGPHDVTSTQVSGGQRLFSSATISSGTTPVNGTQSLASGAYPFFCTIHGGMAAELVVRGTQPEPSNDFTLGKVKKNKKTGTAKLTVMVPGPGELELEKTNKVNADSEQVEFPQGEVGEDYGVNAGNETLSIKPRGKAKKMLNKKGKAKVKANVTYTPTGGSPNTEDKKIKLVKR